ncbi:MAG TPA: CTP synthetase [Aliiroseovarius sp.]|nr:CTP synthetase [Aliiroseovarius sp.]
MLKLIPLIYIIAGATLAGIFMVAGLTMGYDTSKPIIIAALSGFAVALPVTWLVARKLADM